jgi:hypothetical protein
MPYSLSRLGKAFFPGIFLLLVAGGLKAAPGRIFFHSSLSGCHIFRNYTLYKPDTLYSPVIGFVHRERNGDLVIAIPPALLGRYKILFFDADHYFLFEIRQILDPLLIVEKGAFQHAGRFQYELYRDNALVEKSSFLIRNE